MSFGKRGLRLLNYVRKMWLMNWEIYSFDVTIYARTYIVLTMDSHIAKEDWI